MVNQNNINLLDFQGRFPITLKPLYMRKEIIFAIIAGSTLGLLIAYGAWRVNIALSQKDNNNNSSTNTTSQNTNTDENFKIALAKPNDRSVFNTTPITVTGVTKPNSWIVATSDIDDEILNSSDSGTFTTNLDLDAGANQINVTAFDKDQNQTTTGLIVTYSSQFQLPTAPITASNSGTPDEIRANLEQKLAAAQNVPTSFIGTITDISNSTIQIKSFNLDNKPGDIEQITGDTSTTYVKTINDNVKTIKSTDLAIGDFILAMGIKNVNGVLAASRILVTDPIQKTTLRAFMGTVTTTATGKLTVKNEKSGETVNITPGDEIKITGASRFSQITKDTKIIAVGEFKNGTIDARTVVVLK